LDTAWIQAVSTIGLGAAMTIYLVMAGRRFMDRLMTSSEVRETALLKITERAADTNASATAAIREQTVVTRELREAVDNNTRVISDIVRRLERSKV
jgi:C4-dicarboxylate-specific signal transduction histidine kinase